ncbi:hypothetical protein ABZ252_12290 [Streptomyces sp. NPDC006175]|uniref:hypothetical protein n=1 Tax=Streptomyces sp. NPDC006175 TaxID=3154471 RepID=UPI0033A85BB4
MAAPVPTAVREQELAAEADQLRKALSDSCLQYRAMRRALARPAARQGPAVHLQRWQAPGSGRPLLAG